MHRLIYTNSDVTQNRKACLGRRLVLPSDDYQAASGRYHFIQIGFIVVSNLSIYSKLKRCFNFDNLLINSTVFNSGHQTTYSRLLKTTQFLRFLIFYQNCQRAMFLTPFASHK